MLLIIDNRSYQLINSNPYQEAMNFDDTSTHDGIVSFTSGKGQEENEVKLTDERKS
jgi:hypothetical protein